MSCTRAAWFASAAVTLLLAPLASSDAALPAENHYKIYDEVATEIPAINPIVSLIRRK